MKMEKKKALLMERCMTNIKKHLEEIIEANDYPGFDEDRAVHITLLMLANRELVIEGLLDDPRRPDE